MKISTFKLFSTDFATAAGEMQQDEKVKIEEPKKGFFQKIKDALQEWSNGEYVQTIQDDNKV